MKKRSLLIFILLVFAVLAGAAGGGYYWLKSKSSPPELPLYTNIEEIQRDIERLEGLREAKGLSWQDAFVLGVAYIHSERLDDAVTTLEEARRLRPGYHKTYESLGMAYFRLGELDKAVATWKRALEIRPDATHLKEMIERADRKLVFERRISTLEQAVEDGRAGWRNRLELASLYIAMNRLEEAKVQLKEALKEKQDSPEIYDTLAQVHAMGGDFEKAVEAEKKAVRLNPDDDVLGKRLEEMERLKAAIKSGDLLKPAP